MFLALDQSNWGNRIFLVQLPERIDLYYLILQSCKSGTRRYLQFLGPLIILVNSDRHSYLIRPLILEISGHRSYSIRPAFLSYPANGPAPHLCTST